jgi:ribulose-5-phosphate 4-epimerase/fuculose-1-phosphate aldolase
VSSKQILEEELKIASEILEYEIGDIYGHVGVRDPSGDGILIKIFRPPDTGENQDWLVQFDYSLKKVSGVGNPPREAAIYTEIFKRRPDVKAAVHTHAPMCIALSLADRPITTVHMQSSRCGAGVPIFPRPIFILDFQEGDELAEVLDQHSAVVIKGHGIVTVGNTVDEACMNALYLERTAKIQSMAHLLGFPGPTEEFLQTMEQTKRKLFSTAPPRPSTIEASSRPLYSSEWRYYADKIKKGERWSRGWT